MKFFTTPNSKNIISTLCIVTIEKPELTFLLMFYFYDNAKFLFHMVADRLYLS